ncbi:MAG: hypothetical protein AAGJ18_19845, partial [Bacteroidota bacterium]
MGFFDRLFGSTSPTVAQPAISFGRYSDSYKSKEQYEAWSAALQLFEKQEYLASFRAFFTYLQDKSVGNVTFSEHRGDIKFEVIQGSKKIVGGRRL